MTPIKQKSIQREICLIMTLNNSSVPRLLSLRLFRINLVGALCLAALGWATLSAPTQAAEDTSAQSNVIATVNGVPITYEDIALAENELMGLLGKLPEGRRFEVLVSHMIDRILAAQAAEKAGLSNDPAVAVRRAFMERKALQDVFVGNELMRRVTDAEVDAYYQQEIVNGDRQDEVRARHILLDSRESADAVVVALKDGVDFVTLAKERSKGPSGPSGGDLGYFGKEAMVEPFADAAFKMKKGEISAPVKTQFGWHIIKVEDRRAQPTPALEDVRDQIFQILIGDARRDIYTKMRAEADVQFVDASGDAAPAAQ
jgi:peptidyl-prolyl cis-trans isomerase C